MEFDEPAKERLMAEIAERIREERLRAANRKLRTINLCNEPLVLARKSNW